MAALLSPSKQPLGEASPTSPATQNKKPFREASSPSPGSQLQPGSKEKWSITGKSPAAKAQLRAKMNEDISEGVCRRQQDFKRAWDNLQLWMNSTEARDTPTNLSRLEEAERLSRLAVASMKDPRERIKAFQLLIISSYHVTAYSSQGVTQEERWAAGKRVAQLILREQIFAMPEVALALAREGTALGHFQKGLRRQLVGAVVDASEFVYSLRPLRLNGAHPPPPLKLLTALEVMAKDGSAVTRECNVGHVLSLVENAAPLQDGALRGTAHSGSVTCCKVFGERRFLTSGDDGKLAIWNIPKPKRHAAASSSASSLSPSLQAAEVYSSLSSVVGGGGSGVGSGMACLGMVAGHGAPVTALEVWQHHPARHPLAAAKEATSNKEGPPSSSSSSSFRALTASADWSLKLWDVLPNMKLVGKLAGHKASVTCCAVLLPTNDLNNAFEVVGEGKGQTEGGACRCLSGSLDGSLKVWDLEEVLSSGKGGEPLFACLETCEGAHPGGVACLAVFPADSGGASGGTDEGKGKGEGKGGKTKKFLTGGADGRLRIWDVADLSCCRDVDGEGGGGGDGGGGCQPPNAAAGVFAQQQRQQQQQQQQQLGAAGERRLVPVCAFEGHEGGVTCAKVYAVASPASSKSGAAALRALTGGADETLKVWSLLGESTGFGFDGGGAGCSSSCLWVLEGCNGSVWDCVVFGGGTRAVSASDDTCLRVWDLESGGQALCVLPGHPHRDYCLDMFNTETTTATATTANDESGTTGVKSGVSSSASSSGKSWFGTERLLTGGDDPSAQVKVWHCPAGGLGAFEFALGPASIPPLLEALSPKPAKKGKRRSNRLGAAKENNEAVEAEGEEDREEFDEEEDGEEWRDDGRGVLNMMNVL